jgi:hypothetical protein
MNWKGSAEQENKSCPPPAWQHHHNPVNAQQRQSQQWGINCPPSSSLQSPYTTLWLLFFFNPLKDALQGRHLVEDDKLKHSTHQELQHSRTEFYKTSIWHLINRWKSVLIMKEILWKNNLDFVKNVSIICKFHCNSNHSFWEKYRRYYFCTGLHIIVRSIKTWVCMQVDHITEKVLLPWSRCQDKVTKYAYNLWTNMRLYSVLYISKKKKNAHRNNRDSQY